MRKNVLIPRYTLARIIEMLDCLDIPRLPDCYDYAHVIRELKVKMQRLELREAYTRMIQADDGEARHWARIEYLRQRRQLGNVDIGELPF